MSNSIIIDVTEAMKNPDMSCPLSFSWELGDILPYVGCSVKSTSFSGFCSFSKPDVDVVGTINLSFVAQCDRCGDKIEKDMEINFEQAFSFSDDDIFVGHKIDLTQSLIDEILLSVPTQLLCKTDCKGVCFLCGCNLNKGHCGCDNFK